MGNCCSGGDGGSPSIPGIRRSNFTGPGRTLGGGGGGGGGASPARPGQPTPPAAPVVTIPQSVAPSAAAAAAAAPPGGDGGDEAQAERRKKALDAIASRNAGKGGKLAQDLAKQKAQGMASARQQDAEENVRHREMDATQSTLRGD